MKTVRERKTIEVTLALWTDDLPEFPGHSWDHGIVRLPRNDTHDIQACEKHIYTLDELPDAIRELLTTQEITLHIKPKAKNETSEELERSRNRAPGATKLGWKRS